MASMLRVLLWTAVIVAPGGVLLLPFLAAGPLRQRAKLNRAQLPAVGP